MNIGELAQDLCLEEWEYLELIELFIETGISELAELHCALEQGDADKAHNAAHSLKGAASSLGLMEAAESAREIEERAGEGHLEGTTEAAQALKERLDEISGFVGKISSEEVMV